MKSYKLIKKGVLKNNFYNPNIPIEHTEFVSLVEKCDWLTWHELTEWGKDFHAKHEDLPKKMSAYVNTYKDLRVEISISGSFCIVTFEQNIIYTVFKLIWDFAQNLECNIWDRDSLRIISETYLETLRINEENRGIKLTKEQSKVLDSIEAQCRWFYVPTEDVQAVFPILGIKPELKEAHLTEIIDDVQFENKIVVASFIGHTILFGLNAPYIAYPNLNAYMDAKDQHTPDLQNTLNKLSKTFGTAAYFEYNNDDEMIASLAWSSKGKFVYGRFTSEGEGIDIFGTQKKAMEVNQKTLLKTAKKLGMTPGDILTGIMKQNQKVQYFTQCDWNIESMFKLREDKP